MLNYPNLDKKVNSARDCIERCDGKSGDSCFTSCVNLHWPGATFEDAGIVEPVASLISSEKTKITPTTTNHMVSFPTMTSAVGPLPTAATATAGPADDLIPFLMSIFSGLSGPSTRSMVLPSALPSTLALDSSGILNASSFTSQFPISTMIPSFTTSRFLIIILCRVKLNNIYNIAHTTVTSLVTVTPNPISVSATNNNNTSHGIKNLIDSRALVITFFLSLIYNIISLV